MDRPTGRKEKRVKGKKKDFITKYDKGATKDDDNVKRWANRRVRKGLSPSDKSNQQTLLLPLPTTRCSPEGWTLKLVTSSTPVINKQRTNKSYLFLIWLSIQKEFKNKKTSGRSVGSKYVMR